MKATFIQRLLAYLLDFIVISLIFSLITAGFKTDNSISEKYDVLYEKLMKEEITSKEYLNDYTNLIYENQKANVIPNTFNIVLIIVYFIIFQYLNKGQTIGKKLMKIKIVNDKKQEISLLQMFIRSIMIYSIFSGLTNILLLFNISKKLYMSLYLIIGSIESLILLLCAIFILYRNDKRALHDIATKTMVIKA